MVWHNIFIICKQGDFGEITRKIIQCSGVVFCKFWISIWWFLTHFWNNGGTWPVATFANRRAPHNTWIIAIITKLCFFVVSFLTINHTHSYFVTFLLTLRSIITGNYSITFFFILADSGHCCSRITAINFWQTWCISRLRICDEYMVQKFWLILDIINLHTMINNAMTTRL